MAIKITNKDVIQSYLMTVSKYNFSVYEKRILYRLVEAMQGWGSPPASYNIEAPFWVFVFLPQIFLRMFSVPIFTDLSVILQPYIKKSNLQDNNT